MLFQELTFELGVGRDEIVITVLLTQEINQNINGDYYILIPADGSTEWMMNIGNHISYKNVVGGRAMDDIHEIFRGYLDDDIALAMAKMLLKNLNKKLEDMLPSPNTV